MSLSVDQAFGKALRALRMERGVSQERLAELCRLTRTHISRLERGAQSPTLGTVEVICAYLNIDLAELLERMRHHGYGK